MKNQILWGRNFITKVFTHFCSKNVLLLTRNCFYYKDVYENIVSTSSFITLIWVPVARLLQKPKSTFFESKISSSSAFPSFGNPSPEFFPQKYLGFQGKHCTYFFLHFSSLCLVWLSSFQPPGNFGQIWGGLREDRQQKIDSLTHRRLFTIFHLVQK